MTEKCYWQRSQNLIVAGEDEFVTSCSERKYRILLPSHATEYNYCPWCGRELHIVWPKDIAKVEVNDD